MPSCTGIASCKVLESSAIGRSSNVDGHSIAWPSFGLTVRPGDGPIDGKRVSPPDSGSFRYMKKVRTRGPCGAHTAVFWSWCWR